MFERFTDEARRVLVLAQEEARLLNHNFVGTEHILLGLIKEGEGVAAKALEALGVSLEAVRAKAEETVAPAGEAKGRQIVEASAVLNALLEDPTHQRLIMRLFEREVPEISSGVVEIRAVAREPGHRTKIAVGSNDPAVDPVGACVGARGARVRMVTNELRGEKVDIVPYSDDPAEFVQRALQPARVKEVHLDDETGTATVIVHDFQLSLAIGKEGQNARLAARLTGWRLVIKSESQLAEEAAHGSKEWAEGGRVQNETGTGSALFTARAKRVLELSLREALQLGHNYIGTEHMLLALVREGESAFSPAGTFMPSDPPGQGNVRPEGKAAQILVSLGADLSRVRQQVIALLSGYHGREGGPGQATHPVPGPGSSSGGLAEPPGAPPACPTCGATLAEQGVWSTLSIPPADRGGEPRSFTVIYCRACGTVVAVLPGDANP